MVGPIKNFETSLLSVRVASLCLMHGVGDPCTANLAAMARPWELVGSLEKKCYSVRTHNWTDRHDHCHILFPRDIASVPEACKCEFQASLKSRYIIRLPIGAVVSNTVIFSPMFRPCRQVAKPVRQRDSDHWGTSSLLLGNVHETALL